MWTYQYVDRKDILHYGVPGMKWGVRRTPEQLGYGRSSKKSNNGHEKVDKRKAKAEVRKLKAFYKYDETDAELEECKKISQAIAEKSGDWYNGKSVTEGHREKSEKLIEVAHALREATIEYAGSFKFDHSNGKAKFVRGPGYKDKLKKLKKVRRVVAKHQNELSGQVLRDIGFEDTKEARELMRGVLFTR